MFKRLSAACVALLLACGASPEVRVGEGKIPKVSGNKTFSIGTHVCGDPIAADGYTVTSKEVNSGADCEYSFDQVVEVIRQSDYDTIGDLKLSSNLVQAIEFKVETLSFTDPAKNNMPLDYNGYVKTLSLRVEGQEVADKSKLAMLPITVKLTGSALSTIKVKVDARQPASVHVTAVLVVPKSPPLPAELNVTYSAQPTLVLGTGTVNLGQ